MQKNLASSKISKPVVWATVISQATNILTAIAVLIHFALMISKIFFCKPPITHERLGFNLTEATKAAAIVANAGLYNGFIASGLTWGIISDAII